MTKSELLAQADALEWALEQMKGIDSAIEHRIGLREANLRAKAVAAETAELRAQAAALEAPTKPELTAAAEAVVWFDWSGNDSDAVSAMDRLRRATEAAAIDAPEQSPKVYPLDLNVAGDYAGQAAPEPVMFAIRSTRDGSFTDRVAVCGWASFEERLHDLKHEPWVQTGMAEIAPLYLAPVDQSARIALLEGLLGEALDTCHLGDDAGLHKRIRAALEKP